MSGSDNHSATLQRDKQLHHHHHDPAYSPQTQTATATPASCQDTQSLSSLPSPPKQHRPEHMPPATQEQPPPPLTASRLTRVRASAGASMSLPWSHVSVYAMLLFQIPHKEEEEEEEKEEEQEEEEEEDEEGGGTNERTNEGTKEGRNEKKIQNSPFW